jgi:alkylation response protein AidB-like acyl-CoA dehydrogenase
MGRAAACELVAWGDECERQPAVLRSFDGWGNRVDEVVYPDAWRRIAATAARCGLVALPYESGFGPDARLVQAAHCYLFAPSTATYLCPVAMTDGAARVLADEGSAAHADPLQRLTSRDPSGAWTSGQWMTERQGGSDVGKNAVVARQERGEWRLYGEKFFCSNVGCEMSLALARPEGAPPGTPGLALFLVPKDLPDGHRNRYRINRLKDKLGTRAMATGEVSLEGAYAELVGEAEQGFAQMTAMLNITRLHNAITAAGLMRRAWMLASAYASQREAFGRPLAQHPLQQKVLAEMAAQADGAMYLAMRMAQLLGRIERRCGTPQEAALFRLGIALVKLYTGKQAVAVASEALECFGGQGYMEDTGLPRLLRDAQVLPIWEGTTNVLSLDALRVLRKPEVLEAFAEEMRTIDAPDHEAVSDRARKLAADRSPGSEAAARSLAYGLSECWIDGLLRQGGRDVMQRGIAPSLR